MKNMFVAEDESIYLRMISIRDTENILKWRNSDFVAKNFIFREEITEEMHEEWIHDKVDAGKVIQFIVGIKEDNSEIGSVYFQDIDDKCEKAEFGIFLDQAASGKGIGYKATKLALKYIFEEIGFDIITLRVLESNKAAIRLYEKTGFKFIIGQKENRCIDGKMEEILFMKLYKQDFK